ncbi:MAG: helix-turn-helix domain-containing protein [Maribacter sp.]|nr:helix-turn-helix domain-containing protein [Maribacter sp.]
MISNREDHKEEFLDVDALLVKKDGSEGIEKTIFLFKLYFAHVFNSTEVANDYNNQALQLSLDIGYKKGELSAKYNRAYLLFIGGHFNESMDLVQAVEKIVDYESYPEISANVQTLKSDIYTERGAYDLALETGLKLLDEGEKSKNEYVLMRGWSSLSHYYLRNENYSKALSHCLKGLHYIIKLRKIIYIYPKIDEIARMSAKLNDTKTAMEAYAFYLEIEKKIPPPGSYFQSIVYMNMADIYMANEEIERAQEYLSQSLNLIYENMYRFRIPRALTLQAELLLKKKDTVGAISNYEESISAAEEINAFDVVKSNSAILANLYDRTNQPSKAYEYQALHTSIQDSLFTREKEQKITILETRRKIKEITQGKKILELENEVHKRRHNTITIVLIFLLLISILSMYSYLMVRKKNKVLYNRTMESAEVRLKVGEHEIPGANDVTVVKNTMELKSNLSLDEDVKDIILSKLEKFEKDKLFLDANCSLRNLAGQLKTNPKYLSQVINQEKKSNFNHYINGLRINYLLSRLLKEKDFRENKLSYIAASVGYNNLNTFNSAFKKRQGILPSYFIRRLIQELKETRSSNG